MPFRPAPGGWVLETKVTLIVENPKTNTRYYVVTQPVFTPPTYILKDGPPDRPFMDDDETVDSDDTRTQDSDSSNSDVHLTVKAKQVRNLQPHCTFKSCGKFCKRGAKYCSKCDAKLNSN
jgi:hypothetical protein